VLQVNFDRFLGNTQQVRDVPVPVSTSYLLQNLNLSGRQALVGYVLSELGCQLGRDAPFPGVYLTDRIHQRAGGHVLQ